MRRQSCRTYRQFPGFGYLILLIGWTICLPVSGQASPSQEVIDFLDQSWVTERYKSRAQAVRGFPVALGKMKKIRGIWQLEEAQAVSGQLERITWQVRGEPVAAVFDEAFALLNAEASLVWQCAGRSCGNASEWASRVYQERLLYGRDEYQAYAAFKSDTGEWITLFSAARTADRQYLHLDRITPD